MTPLEKTGEATSLLNAIAPGAAYRYFATPDGVEYLGLGTAWSGHRAPESSFGPIAFLARNFAASEACAFGDRWVVPEVTLRKDGDQLTLIPADARVAWDNPPVIEASQVVRSWDDGPYGKRVQDALDILKTGAFDKLVVARREAINLNRPIDCRATLAELLARFPTCHTFAVSNGQSTFLGATPEVLVRKEANVAALDALAGSTKRGTSDDEDARLAAALLDNVKERNEHAWVVQMIVNAVEGFGQVKAPKQPEVRKLANVQHLHTPIRALLNEGVAFDDLVDALHPTPAVGGWPKAGAVETIRALEGFDRGLYAGVVGIRDVERDVAIACVAIRSALVTNASAWAFAGAGIVLGSQPEAEARETRLKLSAVVEAIR